MILLSAMYFDCDRVNRCYGDLYPIFDKQTKIGLRKAKCDQDVINIGPIS